MAAATTIAAIVTAAAAVAGTAYTLSQGKPEAPDFSPLAAKPQPAPQGPQLPPPTAPDTAIETEEQKARQRAARRVRDLQSRQSAPSTALSAPLGISAPTTPAATTVLGR